MHIINNTDDDITEVRIVDNLIFVKSTGGTSAKNLPSSDSDDE